MSRAHKRQSASHSASMSKKQKPANPSVPHTPVRRDLLGQVYPYVETLRQHLLKKLPSSSRLRRKKISLLGQDKAPRDDAELRLARLLDTTLVCASSKDAQTTRIRETRWQQYLSFSQKPEESYVSLSGTSEGLLFSQAEIIDFVIWLLFSKSDRSASWPKHLLCDGFRRMPMADDNADTSIPGVFSWFPNSHVDTLKQAPWTHALALLGKSGERIMIDLLLDCSIFVAIQAGSGNYYQLSGIPLSELEFSQSGFHMDHKSDGFCRSPSDITLMRSRVFYARPSLTNGGAVQAGLKHIHALNRFPHRRELDRGQGMPKGAKPEELQQRYQLNTIAVMTYIFPRQFKLHNVFTSKVDRTKTAQRYHDYTVRDTEIGLSQLRNGHPPKVPKRLRGAAMELVKSLQIRHARCSYVELLDHYCPSTINPHGTSREAAPRRSAEGTPKDHKSNVQDVSRHRQRTTGQRAQLETRHAVTPFDAVVDLASPMAHVSAFCRATLLKVIPDGFWGEGATMKHNKKVISRLVDHFVRLRRFETMSLHELMQGLKITDIQWLLRPCAQNCKASLTEVMKQKELFHEFIFYVFDSLLIPLVKGNFYVTESNTDRSRVFYFRHDVWKRVAEPAMAALKETMFQEVRFVDAKRVLGSRALGYSQLRLLPKGSRLRPIANLRRRTISHRGAKTLGPSINTILKPVHTALKLEATRHPEKLGSTMQSINDIYTKLKDFKATLGSDQPPFYFAKVDVHAAFDTIPQDAVVRLMGSVPRQDEYEIAKHVEVTPGERSATEAGRTATKPSRRWNSTALGEDEPDSFSSRLENGLAGDKNNTVFVDTAARKTYDAMELLSLLAEHVTRNLVKIGKKYYRQKVGIPQGSVLSSFLCNYFYADLEIHHLGFLDDSDTLLLRLVDDFLLITLDQSKAVRFVETMHRGIPEYGVQVNPEKTLVNFDLKVAGSTVNKLPDGQWFPYCATLIDCRTLDITRDQSRSKMTDIANTLTVEFGRCPGQNFQRKALNAFKIQSYHMFFDTEHNSTTTVIRMLRAAFAETATKMWAYIRCLSKSKRPASSLVIRTIAKVIDVAFFLLTSKARRMKYERYAFSLHKAQVAMSAYRAFLEVLGRKQAGYTAVISWLRREMAKAEEGR